MSVVIPAALLPADGRFGSGPSKVRVQSVEALAGVARSYLGTSHRQLPVRNEVARLRSGLRRLFSVPDDYEVVLGLGGTTAFWDVAVFSLIRERGQFLSFGEFGVKFAAEARTAPFLGASTVLTSDAGSAPEFVLEDGIDVYATPHNETSTGVAVPVRRLPGSDGALMLHDATSAAAGLPVDVAESDVYYFAPQKGLGSDGGLWLAFVSPAAIARIAEISASGRYIPAFLDLAIALDNSRKEQTNNTPALATIFLAAEQIEWFNAQGGLAWTTERSATSARTLYEWAQATSYVEPFVKDPALRSNVTGTIDFDASVDAAAVSAELRANGVVDTDSYRKLGRNQLRIGMFPGIDPTDVAKLTACIDYVVTALR